jgi:hypothetical protein
MPSSSTSLSTQSLQGFAIVLSTAAAGLNASLSLFALPTLQKLPYPTSVRAFYSLTAVSRVAMPLLLLPPGLVHAYLSWAVPERARAYGVAAALSFALTPWTWAVMMPINWRLWGLAKRLEAGADGRDEEGEAKELMSIWGPRNLFRSTVSLLAGCVGLYAAFS